MANDGQMTLSTYLELDACPSRIAAEETTRAAADAKHDAALAEIIDGGAKNKLHFDAVVGGSVNGLTYTVDEAAGTVTVSGTKTVPTAVSYVVLKLSGATIYADTWCDGEHVLSGCPAGGSDAKYRLYVAKGNYQRFDYGEGVTLTATDTTDIQIVILVAAGYTISTPLVFKPMICSKAAWNISQKKVPYCPTLQELYAMVQNGTRSLQTNTTPETREVAETHEEEQR